MGSSVAKGSSKLATSEQLQPFLDACKKHGVKEFDTARVYNSGKSEELLGAISTVKNDFAIQTKAPGFMPGSLTYDKVITACSASLAALKQDKIDIYYFHGPDRQTPLQESCRAINDLHRQGKFARFGVSNCRADEVEEIASLCKANGWVRPSVYQGGYNPLLRTAEDALFPTLRKHGMVFYAYSPLGGGYFSRPVEQLRTPPAGGRMEQMSVFSSIYVNHLSLELREMLDVACEKGGLTVKEATLRWFIHHSALGAEDAVILGGSSVQQMEENLAATEQGPLPMDVVEAFEALWKRYRDAGKAPAYCV